MEIPKLNFKDCASVFVRDDFYESIQAPKFHDFCSFEEEPGDMDAFFRKSGGVLKAAGQVEGTCLEPNVIKVQKDELFAENANLASCQGDSPASIPDDYSTVERASVCGSKVGPTVPSTTLTENHDKVPLKRKTFKKANIPCNAPVPSIAAEKPFSYSSQQPFSADSRLPSENEDPNRASRALGKRVTKVGSKSKFPPSISSTCVYAASQSVFERKETSENVVLQVGFLGSVSNGSLDIDDLAVKGQIPINPSQHEGSGVKDKKRKPPGRNVDGVVSKALQPQTTFKCRVSKVSRKVSVTLDTESCSKPKEVATPFTRLANQLKCVTSSSFSASSTIAPAHTKKTSATRKVRRNSDQNRRRKSSISTKTRTRRQILSHGLSSEGEERTRRKASEEVPTMSSQASCSQDSSSADSRIRDAGQNGDDILQMSRRLPLLSWTGEMVASKCTKQEKELVAQRLVEVSQEGMKSVYEADGSVEDEHQPVSSEQWQISPRQRQDELPFCEGESGSPDELLSEQLQNLQLKEENESVSQKSDDEHHSRGGLAESGSQLAANGASDLEVCEVGPSLPEELAEQTLQVSRNCQKVLERQDELENLGTSVDKVTVSGVSDTNFSRSDVVNVEWGKNSGFCDEYQAEYRHIDASENFQTRLSVHVSTLRECKATSAGSKTDNADQAPLLEQLQNLRLPGGDDSRASEESSEERIPVTEVEADLLSSSFSERSKTNEETLLSCASTSDIGMESKTDATRRCNFENAALSKDKQGHVLVGQGSNLKGAPHTKSCPLKQNKKGKSVDIAAPKSDIGVLNATVAPNIPEQQTAKIALQSSVASFHMPGPCTVGSAPFSAAGQQKKMKTTCPQPFRLRTQERGALKEVEFNKKVEQYLAAKEKVPFAPFACETSKETKRPPKAPYKESKGHIRKIHRSEVRAAVACTAQVMQHDREEIKKVRKAMVPHSQKMPSFDRPFKPHRSTKTPTIPCSPNFQHKLKKTASTLATVKD